MSTVSSSGSASGSPEFFLSFSTSSRRPARPLFNVSRISYETVMSTGLSTALMMSVRRPSSPSFKASRTSFVADSWRSGLSSFFSRCERRSSRPRRTASSTSSASARACWRVNPFDSRTCSSSPRKASRSSSLKPAAFELTLISSRPALSTSSSSSFSAGSSARTNALPSDSFKFSRSL